MSDAIREAFEKWWLIEMGHSIHDQRSGDGYFPSDADASWEAWKAALQSQTAPAVPDGWKLVPVEPTNDMQETGAKAIRFNTTAINKLWTGNKVYGAMLAAAPQPDHSPDAGKVVWAVIDRDGQIAYSVTPNDEYLEEWAISSCHEHINEAVTEGIEGASQWVVRPLSVGKTAPQPVQSENEVKAQIHALELWSAHFEELADNATENGYPDHGDGIRDAASEMKAEAARLRASQQEGGER